METFVYILLAVSAFATVFVMGWQFGLFMQSINTSKDPLPPCSLYRDEKADFYKDYYGETKMNYSSPVWYEHDDLHKKSVNKNKKNRKKK
jgi:hypothetical protein